MNKARVAEAARGIIQKKNVRKDLKVDFVFSAQGGPASGWHKTKVYPNLKWNDHWQRPIRTEQNKKRVIKKSQPHGRDFLISQKDLFFLSLK